MSLVQKTSVGQIEVSANNDVSVRFELQVLNGDIQVSSAYHRTSFSKDLPDSVALQMYAVNSHLVSMGHAPVEQGDIDRIKLIAETAWGTKA